MKPQHTVTMLISWDAENCFAPDPFDAGNNAQELLRAMLPAGTPIKLKAYANTCTKGMTKTRRIGFKDSGFPLIDTPGGTDAADRQMILDLFKYARDHPPPAYIVIITGDADFFQAAKTLTQLGYTVIVFSMAFSSSTDLAGVCKYSFDWNHLIDKSGLFDLEGNQTLELQPEVVVPKIPREITQRAIFVDLNSVHLPATSRTAMFDLLSKINGKVPQVSPNNIHLCRLFGDKIPEETDLGLEYIRTSSEDKKSHLFHVMTSNVLGYTHLNRSLPSYIIIVTDNEQFSDLINDLKNSGYIVIVCVPSGGRAYNALKNAASVFVYV